MSTALCENLCPFMNIPLARYGLDWELRVPAWCGTGDMRFAESR